MSEILVINGSPSGSKGNSQKLIDTLLKHFPDSHQVRQLILVGQSNEELWEQLCRDADAFIFVTGTYWDSWGSPLQIFLETMTRYEASDLWLGKPAAVLVTQHNVGGKAIVSRLMGVLNTMGIFIPPLAGFVYSPLAKVVEENNLSGDLEFYQIADLKIIVHNLLEALRSKPEYKIWPLDTGNFRDIWL